MICKVPLCSGTVNRGSDVIGVGLLANDFTGFCGLETTSTEISLIDAILKLKKECLFDAENRNNLIDILS